MSAWLTGSIAASVIALAHPAIDEAAAPVTTTALMGPVGQISDLPVFAQ
jgi:hypothetical protein